MRYQNWDVLIFPFDSRVPVQEFKTSCHVIQDRAADFVQMQNNILLLPTVASFIPGLQAGQPFRMSIHCWDTPEPSRYAQNLSKHMDMDLIMFEVRVFIDGRLAGSKYFSRNGPWPVIVDESMVECDKHGELDCLRFPTFHHELLSQSYWNAGDELGRVKIVISEGFLRESIAMPFDRVKNLVAFSFQHAPLDVLEHSCIAWPNAAMWRQVSFVASPQPPTVSPQKVIDTEFEAHSHSPRHRNTSLVRSQANNTALGTMAPPSALIYPSPAAFDPFMDPVMTHWRQASSTDTSMPDYSSSVSYASHSRRTTDPMITDKSDRRFETLQCAGAFESICEALLPTALANTPIGTAVDQSEGTEVFKNTHGSENYKCVVALSDNKAMVVHEEYSTPTLTACPTGSIKSRKENICEPSNNCKTESGVTESIRKVAQPLGSTANISNKRQRVVTPAAFKVIDDEDEPRSSPILRKVSQAAAGQDGKEGERRVLSGIMLNTV